MGGGEANNGGRSRTRRGKGGGGAEEVEEAEFTLVVVFGVQYRVLAAHGTKSRGKVGSN